MSKIARHARLSDDGRVEFAEQSISETQLKEGGFLAFVEEKRPEGIHNYKPVVSKKSNKIVRSWEAQPNFALISQLQRRLDNSDWKITKCAEYQLAGLELPYDIAELHAERQGLRDKINELMEVQEDV